MSEVPYREAGAAALDIRGQQKQQPGASRGLRTIELLHDERRLLGKLALLARGHGVVRRGCQAWIARNAAAQNAIIFVCTWWV